MRSVVAVAVGAVLAVGGLAACSNSGEKGNQAAAEQVEGLPSDIPVAEGSVAPIVAEPGSNHWAFTVVVKDAAAQEAAVQSFVDAGYTEEGRSEYDGRTNVALTKGTVNVALALENDESGNPRVIYNIIDTSGAEVVLPEGVETGDADDAGESAEPSES
jgi:hypothetical protein